MPQPQRTHELNACYRSLLGTEYYLIIYLSIKYLLF